MKKGVLVVTFLFLSLLLIGLCSADIFINEVMPNPIDNCSDCTEWIELYSESPLNLSGWIIDTNDSKNTSLDFFIEDYFIIAKNKTEFLKYWQISPEIVFESRNISLKNSGDYIGLYNFRSIVNETSYPTISENISWNRLENNTFVICNQSTPGSKNLCEQESQNRTNETNQTVLIIPEINMLFPSQAYNNMTNFTITINLINFSQGIYDLKIDIKNGTKYLNRFWIDDDWTDKNSWVDEAINISSNITNFSFNIISIIDSDYFFVGNASLQIKARNNTGIFTSNLSYISIINGSFKIEDDPINESNSSDQEENNQEKSSDIRIIDFPETAKFGSEIKIKLDIYRGNTNKYAVYAYVEKDNERVSDKVTIHINSKYSEYKGTLGINLDCKNESGDYKIVVEGLDEKDTETIFIESCDGEDISNINSSLDSTIGTSSDNPHNNIGYPGGSNPASSNSLVTGSSINNTEQTSAFSFMKILPFILGISIFCLFGYFLLKKY